jgi:hypothetical protein
MQSIPPDVSSEALVAEAYERVRAQLEALLPKQLLQVNLDIPAAVTTVLGVLPKVNALRPQLQALPTFDLAAFDRLEDYALGLSFAQADYSMVSEPPDHLPALSAEATRLRAMLLADATRVVGLREHAPKLRAAASQRRQRAFTQLLLVYQDVRCAIRFLRALQGDADSIAPSLYRGRPRRRKAAASPDQMPARVADAARASDERAVQPQAASGAPVTGKGAQRGGEAGEPFLST